MANRSLSGLYEYTCFCCVVFRLLRVGLLLLLFWRGLDYFSFLKILHERIIYMYVCRLLVVSSFFSGGRFGSEQIKSQA